MQQTLAKWTMAATVALAFQAGCSVPAPTNDRAETDRAEPIAEQRQALEAKAGQLEGRTASRSALAAPRRSTIFATTLAWGQGEGEVGLRPRGFETVAQGPNAIAVAADGSPLLLDRLNGRVLRVAPSGSARTLATVPVDAEDLSVAADGTFAAFSPLRATAWMYRADGSPLGEMKVPRNFRELMGLELGASNRLIVRTAYQERFDIGSPSAPMMLPVALRTKREGAYALPSGQGIAMRIVEGQPEMMITSPNAEGRSTVDRTIAVARAATAARLVGTFGTIACMRLEQVASTPKMSVARSALCIDTDVSDTGVSDTGVSDTGVSDTGSADAGRVVFEQALERPGLYLPRRELTLGAAGHLAFMHATESGLNVTTWEVAR